MRKGEIKRHRRRARLKEAIYELAVTVWNIFLGIALIWGPIVFAIFAGGMIWMLGW